tara:strand:- start:1055 stop:1948 length:894 start_codon:yes stop_codon:yes gene_type:complete
MQRNVTFNTGDKSYHLGISYAHPYMITGGSANRIEKVAKYLDKVDEIIGSKRKHVTVHGSYKGVPITASNTGMGSASVSATVPEMIEACNSPKMTILRIGTCGAFRNYMEIGDFIITQDVDRAESTSDKIMPRKGLFRKRYEAIADELMMAKLLCNAQRNKETFQQAYVGKTRVTDDIYFDALRSKYILTGVPQKGIPEVSARKLKKLQKKYAKLLGVSMEFSVYCALRDKYNLFFDKKIEVGNLLAVSDVVVEKKHSIGIEELEARQPKIEEAQIIIGLETLVSMSEGHKPINIQK